MLVNETQNVILDGAGNGTVRIAFPGYTTIINRITVATSPATRETQCRVYRNFVGPPYMVDSTYTGGTGDTSDTVHDIPDGDCLYIVWEAGDRGAQATVTYSGEKR